jgi:hypothetical protein
VTGSFRSVRSGTPDELGPLREDETWIRVTGELSTSTWRQLADTIAERPDVELSIEVGEDLEMLRWFPGLRRLAARSLRLRSIAGVRRVADPLEWLTLGDTLRPCSLEPLTGWSNLRRLSINGRWAAPATLSTLTGLERLGVGSIDLELLLPLTRLRRFECGLGTIRSLERLPDVGRLELVELWRLRGEHDLEPLARIPSLRYLILASTRSIARLPSFEDARELRWVALESMRGITDLRPIAAAPNLEVLLLVGMSQLDPDDLRPLVGHPSLRAGVWGLGSDRKNRAAGALLPVAPANGNAIPWNQPDWDGVADPSLT